jgi:hypothetical protein
VYNDVGRAASSRFALLASGYSLHHLRASLRSRLVVPLLSLSLKRIKFRILALCM